MLSSKSLCLLDLPMRDGNMGLPARELISYLLLDLPMRDGNRLACVARVSVPFTFRPSYEGWKQERGKDHG